MVKAEGKSNVEAVIEEALPNATFLVRTTEGNQILCHVAGKMRLHKIKLFPGDKVLVEITPYDLARGRIIYKLKL